MADKRYGMLWRNRHITADAESLDEVIEMMENNLNLLKEMREDGVQLDDHESDPENDIIFLYTEDAEVAEKFGLEGNFLDDVDEDVDDIEYDSDED